MMNLLKALLGVLFLGEKTFSTEECETYGVKFGNL